MVSKVFKPRICKDFGARRTKGVVCLIMDFVVDISEPVFVFNLPGFVAATGVDPVVYPSLAPVVETEEPTVEEVRRYEEILLLRAAAQEAVNDSR